MTTGSFLHCGLNLVNPTLGVALRRIKRPAARSAAVAKRVATPPTVGKVRKVTFFLPHPHVTHASTC